jgi:zinc protease
MKKLIYTLLMFSPCLLFAQVKIDRSAAPKPLPAPVIKVGEPASFVLPNGLKVFVVRNTKLPRVAATLTIDRDAILEGDKAGLTSLTGELFRRGTQSMNKAKLDEEIDYLGGTVNTSSSSISGAALSTKFPALFALMADIALRPSFPADELEKIRKQMLSGLAQNRETPAAIASNVVNRLVYGKDHPYGDVETEETVNKVQVADIRNYYNTYWKPNIAYLIFVGDITVETAKALTSKYFAGWQKGEVPKPAYAVPALPAKTYIAIVDRPSSVQSVINIVAPNSLKPGASDDIPASVMNNILGNGSSGRLFKNLREKYGFTYGAYSQLRSDKMVGNFTASASVRNEKTDSAIAQFLLEFNRMRSEPVATEDLTGTINEMNGSFARSLESPATIAGFALNIARYNLPKDYYQRYLQQLAAVKEPLVKAMAEKYLPVNNLHIVIVGNAKQIAKDLSKYGEIRYFDVYGNPKAAPEEKKISADVSPDAILKKAIEAQGGETAMAAVTDVVMKGTASVMGQSLDFSQQYVLPGAFLQTISMGGMALSKQLANNGKYTVSQQGMEQPLKDEDKEELEEAASLFPERFMLKKGGYSFTVKGIESVEGKDAYNLEIKSPKGRVFNYFYDLSSGLRVKEAKSVETPQGKVTTAVVITGYNKINGVMLPKTMIYDAGPVKLNISIADTKVNTGLKADSLQ